MFDNIDVMDFTVEEIKEELRSRGELYIGMPCTMCVGSDRYPFEVTHISESGKTIWVREMTAIPTANYNRLDPEYTYESNKKGRLANFSLRKDGRFRSVGGDTPLTLGVARKYIDPHF